MKKQATVFGILVSLGLLGGLFFAVTGVFSLLARKDFDTSQVVEARVQSIDVRHHSRTTSDDTITYWEYEVSCSYPHPGGVRFGSFGDRYEGKMTQLIITESSVRRDVQKQYPLGETVQVYVHKDSTSTLIPVDLHKSPTPIIQTIGGGALSLLCALIILIKRRQGGADAI